MKQAECWWLRPCAEMQGVGALLPKSK